MRIREEINQLLEKHVGQENIDKNRLEQELIYYMEKIDIHEEQIRLRQHCEYFNDILRSDDPNKGKNYPSFCRRSVGKSIPPEVKLTMPIYRNAW